MNTVSVLAQSAAVGMGLLVTGSLAYLLLLLLAAALRRPRSGCALPGVLPRVDVIIPAHDEELVLGATLRSLAAQEYPADRYRVVVIADNCSDTTAEIAREAGVWVLERVNDQERGKGYALNWAIRQLLEEPVPADAFIVVDADTWVAPDFVSRMATELLERRDSSGRCALQGRYGVLNAGDGWRAALMSAAFDLVNHVRPLGADRLGCSVGLKGNGMAFTRETLLAAPWSGRSITEDIDFGLDLLERHGVRVGYVPEARVLAQMPVSGKQAGSQRARWEKGRYQLLRQRALPLFWTGVCRRDLRLCEAAASLTVPPLVELGVLLVGWALVVVAGDRAHWLPVPHLWYGAFLGGVAGLGVYLFGGLAVAGAKAEAYRALLAAPIYAMWKLALYPVALLRKSRQGEEWVRTERLAIDREPG